MEYTIVLCSIFGEQKGLDIGGSGDGGEKNSSEDFFLIIYANFRLVA